MQNILILTYTDDGGAGKATVTFAEGLIKMGYNVNILVRSKQTNNKIVTQVEKKRNTKETFFQKVDRNLKKRFYKPKVRPKFNEKYFFYLDEEKKPPFSEEDLYPFINFQPHIIIGSWISLFTNFKTIGKLGKKFNAKPYVLTMDMGTFTGGCHYAWECDGYKNSCNNCPAIINMDFKKKLAKRNLKERKLAVDKYKIQVIPCSQETEIQVKNSTLFKNQNVFKKYNGIIDFSLFNPTGRNISRIKTKTKDGAKVILAGATSFEDKRKGFKELIEVLHEIDKKINHSIIVNLISKSKDYHQDFQNIKLINHGFIESPNTLADFYKSADVYISPSLQDSGPVMVIQALSCGTPVVGFEVGFVSEYVINGKNGFICKDFNIQEMSDRVIEVLNSSNIDWSNSAYNSVKDKLSYHQLKDFF